jgi:yersiniabactin nonribosomal peptide synthetase
MASELQSQLPVFMVPNVFHILDKMPVTAGDKIDRAAHLSINSIPKESRKEQARTEEEKLVASIWEKV